MTIEQPSKEYRPPFNKRIEDTLKNLARASRIDRHAEMRVQLDNLIEDLHAHWVDYLANLPNVHTTINWSVVPMVLSKEFETGVGIHAGDVVVAFAEFASQNIPGFDINATTPSGVSLLMLAVASSQVTAHEVNQLIQLNADVNAVSHDNGCVLHHLSFFDIRCVSKLKTLLNAGAAEVKNKNGFVKGTEVRLNGSAAPVYNSLAEYFNAWMARYNNEMSAFNDSSVRERYDSVIQTLSVLGNSGIAMDAVNDQLSAYTRKHRLI